MGEGWFAMAVTFPHAGHVVVGYDRIMGLLQAGHVVLHESPVVAFLLEEAPILVCLCV